MMFKHRSHSEHEKNGRRCCLPSFILLASSCSSTANCNCHRLVDHHFGGFAVVAQMRGIISLFPLVFHKSKTAENSQQQHHRHTVVVIRPRPRLVALNYYSKREARSHNPNPAGLARTGAGRSGPLRPTPRRSDPPGAESACSQLFLVVGVRPPFFVSESAWSVESAVSSRSQPPRLVTGHLCAYRTNQIHANRVEHRAVLPSAKKTLPARLRPFCFCQQR